MELNVSYYYWPSARSFAGWRRRFPPGFTLSFKAPELLTHARKFYAPEGWAARIGAAIAELGDRAGVLLVQLPPTFGYTTPGSTTFWRRAMSCSRSPGVAPPELAPRGGLGPLERYGTADYVMSRAHLPWVLRATAPLVYVRCRRRFAGVSLALPALCQR